MFSDVNQLIEKWAKAKPDSIALEAPAKTSFSYKRLIERVGYFEKRLASMNLKQGRRVALILPENSPEAAALMLAIIKRSNCVMLNPWLTAKELNYLIAASGADAIVIPNKVESFLPKSAAKNRICLLRLFFPKSGKSDFADLRIIKNYYSPRPPLVNNIAFVLHTSGTTANAKIVPLTRYNIAAGAQNLITTFKLVNRDRCLNVMPLFHVHGLMVTIATLAAGGAVICPGKFKEEEFFSWLDKFKPTFYTASPTIHKAIISRASENKKIVKNCHLRFIRSSSAPLSPETLAKLEKIFRAPVLESYGMTEAALQITSNPLPPQKRKMGSAGRPAGPEVRIIDGQGKFLKTGQTGEIIIRGKNVFPGYENDSAANRQSFFKGWFKTGDLGYFDSDGYLFIKSRLKEIVNRGGEKIALREIDETLLNHLKVKEAAAFPMPHQSLGEDIAAAIVLKKSAKISEDRLRRFCRKILPDFKVPSRFLIVDKIPKTPAGKIQRFQLYGYFKLLMKEKKQKPKGHLAEVLAKIWQEVLGVKKVGVNDNFFAIGGDSLKVMAVISRMKKMGINITRQAFFNQPTIEGLMAKINNQKSRSK
jgi:acyl-CoA synthetase (AMP-forming)/AMP-acid ligase II/aryl carrier-like protein